MRVRVCVCACVCTRVCARVCVCARTAVCHGQEVGLGVFEPEVLIFEFCAVDRLAACAIAVREVATLQHVS